MEIREALEKAITEHETGTESETTLSASETTSTTSDTGTSSESESTSSETTSASGDNTSGNSGVEDKKGEGNTDSGDINTDTVVKADKPDSSKDGTDESGKSKTEKSGQSSDKSGTDPEDQGGSRFRVDRAPQSWKGEARNSWGELPLSVRQEIYRRERAVDAAMRESAGAREFSVGFQKMVQPYMDRLQRAGNPIVGIKMLLDADRHLSSGSQEDKAKMIGKLISDYGVNIEILDQVLSQSPNATVSGAPIVEAIRNELDRRLAPITGYIDQRRASEYAQQESHEQSIEQQLMDMANDTDNYEFFHDVMDDMADIMDMYSKKGLAITPQQAYSKAIRIHPEISATVEQREVEQRKRDVAKKLNEEALKAKAASVSVSGAPLGKPTTQVSGNPGDLRSVIMSAMDQVSNGAGRI